MLAANRIIRNNQSGHRWIKNKKKKGALSHLRLAGQALTILERLVNQQEAQQTHKAEKDPTGIRQVVGGGVASWVRRPVRFLRWALEEACRQCYRRWGRGMLLGNLQSRKSAGGRSNESIHFIRSSLVRGVADFPFLVADKRKGNPKI